MTKPAEAATKRRVAFRWSLTWGIAFVVAHAVAVACDVTLIATDAFGRTTANHDEPGFDGVFEQAVSWAWGITLLQAPPLLLALAVLWYAGRKVGPVGFRMLSVLMFFWYAPIWGIFWAGGFAIETWAAAQLVFALVIRKPKLVGSLQTTD